MTRSASRLRLALVAGLFVGSLAAAAPRVVVGELKGDKRSVFTHQVSEQLCAAFDCVPARGIVAKGKVNAKTAKRARISAVFTGAVMKTKKGPGVLLIMESRAGKVLRKWTLLTRKGRLSAVALRQVGDDAAGLIGAPAEPPPAPPTAPEVVPPASSTPEPSAGASSSSSPDRLSDTPASESRSSGRSEREPRAEREPGRSEREPSHATESESGSAASGAGGATPSWLAFEAGFDFLNRSLSYANLTTNNLRTYSAPLIFAPHLHGEVFPLAAGSNPGILGGLGLEMDFAFSLGLKSATAGDLSHPTSYSRFDIDAVWRFPVGSSFVLAPYLGYRIGKFSVSPDANGNVYTGLPNFSDNGVELGLGAEYIVSEHGLRILAKLDYLPKVSGGDLLSTAYFANGSASGLDLALGVSIPLVNHLDLRVLGLLTRYGYSFTTQPMDTYVATGASDVYLGARATARYSF